MNLLDRFRDGRRGASAVEFAIIALPMIILIVGAVDLGRALYIRNDLSRVADVGARVILLDPSAADSTVESAIRDAFLAADPGRMTVSLGSETSGGHAFRTIDLGFPVDLMAPVPGADTITVGEDRRVPIE